MKLSAARFVQGTRELIVKLQALSQSYSIALPGNVPSVGSIPRFKDDQGNLEWFDLSSLENGLEALQSVVDQLSSLIGSSSEDAAQNQAIANLQSSLNSLSSTINQIQQNDTSQASSIQSLSSGLQNVQTSLNSLSQSLASKENSGTAQSLLDAHLQAFNHSLFVTLEQLDSVQLDFQAKNQALHPFNEPFEYYFNHFYGGNTAPFITGSSGTGASGSFLTGTSEGYYRLNSGTAVNARHTVRTALSALRLAQDSNRKDAFRARGYLSNQTSTDRSAIRLGFFNSEASAPTNGVFFLADLSVSNNWQAVVVNSLVNNGVAQLVDTGIAVNTADNRDWQIKIEPVFTLGMRALFFINSNFVGMLSNIPVASGQELFGGATIVKSAGTTNNSISLDHLGVGVKQPAYLIN